MRRLGSLRGALEVKEHQYFSDINWQDFENKKVKPPDPYLAQYAKNIIQVSPYMAAGHPQTRGKTITKDHNNYFPEWSFCNESA